jgi:hypothetical protein
MFRATFEHQRDVGTANGKPLSFVSLASSRPFPLLKQISRRSLRTDTQPRRRSDESIAPASVEQSSGALARRYASKSVADFSLNHCP